MIAQAPDVVPATSGCLWLPAGLFPGHRPGHRGLRGQVTVTECGGGTMRIFGICFTAILITACALPSLGNTVRTTSTSGQGKTAWRGRLGRRGKCQGSNPAGRHDHRHQLDQRVEADAHGLPPRGREEHGGGDTAIPWRRLHAPRLGSRRGAGGPLAQFHRGNGRGAEVPCSTPGKGRPRGSRRSRPSMDAQRAISLVRSKAAEWGVDPKRIGVLGFSAGGHLAAWVRRARSAGSTWIRA